MNSLYRKYWSNTEFRLHDLLLVLQTFWCSTTEGSIYRILFFRSESCSRDLFDTKLSQITWEFSMPDISLWGFISSSSMSIFDTMSFSRIEEIFKFYSSLICYFGGFGVLKGDDFSIIWTCFTGFGLRNYTWFWAVISFASVYCISGLLAFIILNYGCFSSKSYWMSNFF